MELCKKIWPYGQMEDAQPGIHPGEWDAQSSFGLQTDHLISARKPDLIIIKKN